MFPQLSYGREALDLESSGEVIKNFILSNKPFAVGRMGNTEYAICLGHYLRKRSRLPLPYPGFLTNQAKVNAGVFSNTAKQLDQFAQTYMQSVRSLDYLMAWKRPLPFEKIVLEHFQIDLRYLTLLAQVPFLSPNPWSQHLAGLKVLVVHPFARSIQRQYSEHREKLFLDPKVLPKFDMQIVMPPVTHAHTTPREASWHAALEACTNEIAKHKFDIALVSGGSYGLPITAFIKEHMGKGAIHMAGSLQLLFGISGQRWDTYPEVLKFVNEFWCRPSQEERPEGYQAVENAAYY